MNGTAEDKPDPGTPNSAKPNSDKKVFLLTAFQGPDPMPPTGTPLAGMAQDVLAVIGLTGRDGDQRFEWVGADCPDSIARPALVTPVKVRLAVASPWHPPDLRILTGLVQLAPDQLGDGPVDDDLDHLLLELAASRSDRGPTPADKDVVSS